MADPINPQSGPAASSDVAFTPAVKAAQAQRGSRMAERIAAGGGFRTGVTPDLVAFLAGVNTAYLATATAEGQPYVQHRGGPAGFIRVVNEHTLGFADYSGNRQYVTVGNLSENPRAFLFLMDYAHRRRIKLWGRAEVVEDAAALLARLMPDSYRARPERVLLFHVDAWDMNCPQHIPQMFDAARVVAALEARDQRIAELELELRSLRERAADADGDAADGAPITRS